MIITTFLKEIANTSIYRMILILNLLIPCIFLVEFAYTALFLLIKIILVISILLYTAFVLPLMVKTLYTYLLRTSKILIKKFIIEPIHLIGIIMFYVKALYYIFKDKILGLEGFNVIFWLIIGFVTALLCLKYIPVYINCNRDWKVLFLLSLRYTFTFLYLMKGANLISNYWLVSEITKLIAITREKEEINVALILRKFSVICLIIFVYIIIIEILGGVNIVEIYILVNTESFILSNVEIFDNILKMSSLENNFSMGNTIGEGEGSGGSPNPNSLIGWPFDDDNHKGREWFKANGIKYYEGAYERQIENFHSNLWDESKITDYLFNKEKYLALVHQFDFYSKHLGKAYFDPDINLRYFHINELLEFQTKNLVSFMNKTYYKAEIGENYFKEYFTNCTANDNLMNVGDFMWTYDLTLKNDWEKYGHYFSNGTTSRKIWTILVLKDLLDLYESAGKTLNVREVIADLNWGAEDYSDMNILTWIYRQYLKCWYLKLDGPTRFLIDRHFECNSIYRNKADFCGVLHNMTMKDYMEKYNLTRNQDKVYILDLKTIIHALPLEEGKKMSLANLCSEYYRNKEDLINRIGIENLNISEREYWKPYGIRGTEAFNINRVHSLLVEHRMTCTPGGRILMAIANLEADRSGSILNCLTQARSINEDTQKFIDVVQFPRDKAVFHHLLDNKLARALENRQSRFVILAIVSEEQQRGEITTLVRSLKNPYSHYSQE